MKKCRYALLFLVVAVGLIVVPQCSEKEPSRSLEGLPNIILFSIDTLRADHLSCYGYSRDTSPYIDEFARDSVLFENAIAQAPNTSPSHMSVFTALSPGVHGVKTYYRAGDNIVPLSENFPTFAEVLKENGYMTVGYTDGGNVSAEFGFGRGFDQYVSAQINWKKIYKNPEELNDIRNWIRRSKRKGRPLFLFVHNYLCHDPYVRAPEEFNVKFLEEKVEGLPSGPKDIVWDKGIKAMRRSFWGNVDPSNPAHIKHIVSLYDGGILYADYCFGQIMDILKDEGIYTDSFVVLMSDHGEEFYEHQTHLHSRLFIETMSVPLIMKFPENRYAETRIGKHVRLLDIMPTLLDFIGIDIDFFIQGVSFAPLLNKNEGYDPTILSYDADLKSIRFYKDGFVYSNQSSPGGTEWLFDFSKDPRESTNLIEDYPEIREKMRAVGEELVAADDAAREKHKRTKDKAVRPDEETIEQLKALGYIQ